MAAAEPQTQGRVAYQGAPGAYSHAACLDLRPWDEAVAHDTFAEVIAAVTAGQCETALLPLENSIFGPIQEVQDLIAASGLRLHAEAWRPIRLTLMAPEGADLTTVKTAESHPVALAQCRQTLARLGLSAVEAFDTAGAARDVARAADVSRAAVAPALAAEIYGLKILRHDLQDSTDNRTRFAVLTL